MDAANELILLGGALGLLAIVAGALASRFKAPLLLVFLGLGMLAGENGPGGIVFNDFGTSYLLGSVALAVILFQGGLKTERAMVRLAAWPAVLLATLGVLISAAVIGALGMWLFGLNWGEALGLGAAVAPTDAAAVSTLLRLAKVNIPERVVAILELESGLNDPVSVFLMVFSVAVLTHPGVETVGHAVCILVREMLGGAVLGVAGGFGLLGLIKLLRAEAALYPVLAFAGALALFGGAQLLQASGFLAIYIAGVMVGNSPHRNAVAVNGFFDAFAWIAQIGLFLMLGLLVTPHNLGIVLWPAIKIAAALIFLARPLASLVCLAPFRVPMRQIGFISWVGLRGAVPIYLTLIPVLSDIKLSRSLFGLVFIVVIASLTVQGWTVGLAARIFGFGKAEAALEKAA